MSRFTAEMAMDVLDDAQRVLETVPVDSYREPHSFAVKCPWCRRFFRWMRRHVEKHHMEQIRFELLKEYKARGILTHA